MDDQGRVVVPAAVRSAMGLVGPTDLLFRYDGHRLIVEPIGSAVVEVQRIVASDSQAAGRSLADELIAERRAEAAEE